MRLLMAGIDFEHAPIAVRERFSFVAGQVSALLPRLRAQGGVLGCTLLSTCNRTELYLSCTEEMPIDPARLLCAAAGKSAQADWLCTRQERAAARHLALVASGLKSQLVGDDQILSQVKQAAALAREAKTSDPVLETLFRCAVTAGKAVKTETRLTRVPLSAAHRAVELAEVRLGTLAGKRALVIGNGEMGRLACELLVARGAAVTMTLRSYRHGETIVPRGCKTVPYEERFAAVAASDLVLSATASPHFTLPRACMEAIGHKPALLIDLALPRDVEPSVGALVPVLNMDDLGRLCPEDASARAHAEEIIERQLVKFYEWNDYRAALPIIEAVKETAFARVFTGEGDEDAVRAAVDKTVDMLLGAMKETVSAERLQPVLEKMRKA